jgi:hypothetical protein
VNTDVSAADAAAPSLELAEPVPPEVPAGADLVLRVRVRGAACDLRGGRIEVVDGEDTVAVAELTAFDGDISETAAFAVTAPRAAGAFAWAVRFPPQEIGGIAYAESVLLVESQARPHRTSLAVWAVPSPVRMAERFTISVGAKSSGACALGGARIEVRDDGGAIAGEGVLGETPLPGTDALHWTQIALAGPCREGPQHWDVAFAATDVELAHLASSARFGFTAVRPPACRVTVTAVESDGAAPVPDAQVALGPYRAATGKSGMAHFDVPTGTYDLALWNPGFEAVSTAVEISAETTVRIELTRLPEELTVWD